MASVTYDSARLGNPQAKMEPHPSSDFVPHWIVPETEALAEARDSEEAKMTLKAKILAAFGVKAP